MKAYRSLVFGLALVALLRVLEVLPVGAGEAKPPWQSDWERAVEAARKEGQLVVYGGRGYEPLFSEFQKRYPEMRITYVLGRIAEIMPRLLAERRAGQYLADLWIGSSATTYTLYEAKVFDLIKPLLLLPEVLDQSKWWKGKHHYLNPEGQYVFLFNGRVDTRIAYNTRLPKEVRQPLLWENKFRFVRYIEETEGLSILKPFGGGM